MREVSSNSNYIIYLHYIVLDMEISKRYESLMAVRDQKYLFMGPWALAPPYTTSTTHT